MRSKAGKYVIEFSPLILICILIWPAIYNGYPLVYSDTGTYISSGFSGVVPVDRPIIYGWFVRYMSLSHSLWFVLLAQAVTVFFEIYMVARRFISGNTVFIAMLITCILSFTTGLSNYTSQIMPDIFSALSIMGFAVILTAERMR